MGRSSRRYLQPQTPRRAALGPAELPKFGPASACRAAAPSPAVPGRAKPSPAVPSRSGVPRAPPAAQRPDTEGTGEGRKGGRKEKRKGLPQRDLRGRRFSEHGVREVSAVSLGAAGCGAEVAQRNLHVAGAPPGSPLSPQMHHPQTDFYWGIWGFGSCSEQKMLIPCSWLPLPPRKTLLGAGSSAGRAGVTVTLPLLPPAPQRDAQGHQEAPQKGCTPRRTLGEVLGPRAVSLEQWHSSRSTGLGGRLHSTHRAPRHPSEHRVPKGQAQGCAHCLPSPTALHNAPPPHLSWACNFLPCHLRGQEGRRHPLGLAPGAWHWWQGVEPERGGKLLIPGFHVSDLRPR